MTVSLRCGCAFFLEKLAIIKCRLSLPESVARQLEYLHHVPNGGKRDKATATALKRQGVKAGVPDIVLPAVRAGYHGLYIELKAGKNTTTDNQKRWLEYLRQQGYYTAVCYGWQPAAELIERYLLHPEELTQEQKTITMR